MSEGSISEPQSELDEKVVLKGDGMSNEIGARRSYPHNHLLGLPLEIRDNIWALIYFATMQKSDPSIKWNARREVAWDQVPFTCRQIYEETKAYWPRSVVRVAQIPAKLQIRGFTIPVFTALHHLTLEVPRDYTSFPHDWQTAAMLDFLSPFLRDLRIYFVGEQGPSGRTGRTSKDCLLETERRYRNRFFCTRFEDAESDPVDLTVERKMRSKSSNKTCPSTVGPASPKAIIDVIQKMSKLVTLVLDDIEMLLISSALMTHKPDLERLHVTTSPDALLHRHPYGTCAPYVITLPKLRLRPCLRKLCLSANAIFDANQLAFAANRTLREFTWTVPCMSSKHDVHCDWIRQTAELLRCLAVKAIHLQCLRLCIEEEISEARHSDSELIGTMTRSLKLFTSLRVLEMHLLTDSPFLGAEVLQALPFSVKRFYTTEDFIDPKTLVREVERRYLKGPLMSTSGRLGFIGYQFTTQAAWNAALNLNGRLLDRERNIGCVLLREQVTSAVKEEHEASRSQRNANDHTTILRPKNPYALEKAMLMPINELLTLPTYNDNGDFRFDGRYDVENEILDEIWRQEPVARHEDLPPLKWVDHEAVRRGEHWMSE